MDWWAIIVIVWVAVDIFLSLNYIIRQTYRGDRMNWKRIALAFYDSFYWPLFLVLYGVEGIWREITGRPW